MRGLIRFALMNPWAVTVFALAIVLLGILSLFTIPIDILPEYSTPAVQVMTFYGGMPPEDVQADITHPMERWTGMAPGISRQEARSILGCSIIRNFFHEGVDTGEALSQVISMAQSEIPNLPPGTFPPVVLSFDPTSMTPVCLVALQSKTADEAALYDVGRYEVRSQVMTIQGAVSPVVFGGKLRAVQVYLDRQKMQARGLSPTDVMTAVENGNVFLPTGEAILGDSDYFLSSNSMFKDIKEMGNIPLRTEHGNRAYVKDVATPTDSSLIQTTIVRVGGRKAAYIPVMRSLGASTVSVVDQLKEQLGDIQAKLTRGDINLQVIMDQSVYVRTSIEALATEGLLGAVLCSLVILLFLGRWRMTLIAVMTIPISVLAAITLLYVTGNTINVMTLSGLSMAIGPMVDSAIISLENIDRHLERGAPLRRAALDGPAEVALPELVASLSTLTVLAPLALMPSSGQFLFQPMTLAVGFAMGSAYILSRTFVPARAAAWLKEEQPSDEDQEDEFGQRQPPRKGFVARAFDRWQGMIETGIGWYGRRLAWVLEHTVAVVVVAFVALLLVIVVLAMPLRQEFFPEVDSGAFEIFVRAPSGTKLEKTNDRIAEVEDFLRQKIAKDDLRLIVSEIGVTPDWSAGYTRNAGKMDTIVRVQLTENHQTGAYEYANQLRQAFKNNIQFSDLEFAFNPGGLIRGALNQGKPTPIDIRVVGRDAHIAHKIADNIRRRVDAINGVVDARIIQRLNYPTYRIDVDRLKAADLGLSQFDVITQVISAFNSSIQFNKRIFWVDPVGGNQYFVGVQYPLEKIKTLEDLLDVPVTGVNQIRQDRRVATPAPPSIVEPIVSSHREVTPPIPLGNLVELTRSQIPTEITDLNLHKTIDLYIGVHGRDLGHVASDIYDALSDFGTLKQKGAVASESSTTWQAYDPNASTHRTLQGYDIILSGEYAHMNQAFKNLAIGLCLSIVLIYFMMVALDRSYMVPLVNLLAVPLMLIGVLPMLYITGTSLNIQSLLGIIFVVGIQISNTVLMTDVAQEQRKTHGLEPVEAVRKAALLRVRPIIMTALAAFFALIPTALALEKGSEANAPLGRAILGGLLAGAPATLIVVPALYSLMIHGEPSEPQDPEELPPAEQGNEDAEEDES